MWIFFFIKFSIQTNKQANCMEIRNKKYFINAVKIEYLDYSKDSTEYIDFNKFVDSRIIEINNGTIQEDEYYAAIEEILTIKRYIKIAS